jgi:hypothetical protein
MRQTERETEIDSDGNRETILTTNVSNTAKVPLRLMSVKSDVK